VCLWTEQKDSQPIPVQMSMRDRCTDGVNRKTTVEANAVKSTDDGEIREDRLQMNDGLFMPVNRWTA